jgi:integrase
MLLVHHPLRNKHYREARLARNLVKTSNGEWHLCFAGEGVPAGRKDKKSKDYDAPLAPEVAEYLERYLQEWRPRLIGVLTERLKRLRALKAEAGGNKVDTKLISELEQSADYLFLNGRGRRFNTDGFSQWIQAGTYRWLGVRVNPQLISEIAKKGREPSSVQTATHGS